MDKFQLSVDTAIEMITKIWETGDHFNISLCNRMPIIWYSHVCSGGAFNVMLNLFVDDVFVIDPSYHFDLDDPEMLSKMCKVAAVKRDALRVKQDRMRPWDSDDKKDAVISIHPEVIKAGFKGPTRLVGHKDSTSMIVTTSNAILKELTNGCW